MIPTHISAMGQQHEAVVGIPVGVEALGYHTVAPHGTGTEKFADETEYYQYHTVAQAVAYTVEECGPRFVAECERLYARPITIHSW